jgi:hypothetical protein
MTETYIQIPADGTGKKVRNIALDIGGSTVYQQVTISGDALLTQVMDNNASGQPIYIGEALPGSSKASALWRIKKVTYDGNNFITDVQWADSTVDFVKVWNDRASYTYA